MDDTLTRELYELVNSCAPGGAVRSGLDPAMTLRKDLGFDSVQLLLLMYKFEERYGCRFPPGALPSGAMSTLGELVECGRRAIEEG